MRLEGKSAIVTGAAKGIGRAIAETFVREGCKVLLADIDAETGTATAEAIRAQGADVAFRVVDVSQRNDVSALVSEGVERFGRLDIMVNNAGIPYGSWDETLRVNLGGVAHGIRYAARAMAEAGGGSIISTASVAGIVAVGAPIDSGTDAYVASKHGVVGVTREFALAYGPYGVRVNCVCPGPTETDMIRGVLDDQDWRKRVEAMTALKRVAQPQEIANVFLFLASDESSFITGAAIVVDGGQTAA